jgi:hypothetical protein
MSHVDTGTHRLILNHDGGRRSIYDFVLESEGRMGWAMLRLVRIEDDPSIEGVPAVVNYDPAVHDGGSHYMSHLWRARGIHLDGAMRYSLVGAFGTPGYIQLERLGHA